MNQSVSSLPPGVRLGMSPLSWANDVLEDLGANIPLETCLDDAATIGYQGVELGRKFPRPPFVDPFSTRAFIRPINPGLTTFHFQMRNSRGGSSPT